MMRRLLVGFTFLFVSVLATTLPTEAKPRLNDSGTNNEINRVVFMQREEFSRIAKSLGRNVRSAKLSKKDLANLSKLASTRCGCAAMFEEDERAMECFKGCLGEWGVNSSTIMMCAGVCGLGSGTPGLVVCAACVGIGEWIVMGCALYCVWTPILSKNETAAPLPNFRGSPRGNVNATKLPRKVARSNTAL